MKKLLLLLALALPSFASYNGYSYTRPLTLDHTQVPNTNQTNFPVWVHISNASLKTVANGGKVQNVSGFDVVFASDAPGTVPLTWQMDFYDGVNGVVDAWVKVPTVSTTLPDTTFYVFYGNASITTFQSTASSVWSNGFTGVWHLSNTTGSLTATDSTTSSNNGTVGSNSAVAGQIDGASNQTAQLTLPETTPSVWVIADLTISAWFKTANDNETIFWSQSGTPLYAMVIGDPVSQGSTTTRCNVYQRKTGSIQVASGTTSVRDGVPHYCVITRTSSTGVSRIYVDGVLQTTSAALETGTLDTSSSGSHFFGVHTSGFADETRLANTPRSADWISTEWNNQKSGSTFLTVGSESTSFATGVILILR